MQLKKAIVVLIIIVLSFSIYGCKAIDVMKGLISEDEQEPEIVRSDDENLEISAEINMRDTVLYFKNENGYLVPVKRQIPWEEGIAKAALRNMMDTPTIREDLGVIGLLPVIPSGTEIRGMAINQETGLCKVDFTSDILNYTSQKDEENLVKGIVYTLTEFPAISEVQFMIDGEIVNELKYGTRIDKPLKREDINLIDSAAEGGSKVIVYYKGTSNGEYEYYVPVTVPTFAPVPDVMTALEELFNGAPASTGLYSDIPEGVQLQGMEIKDGIAYIDLSLESEEAVLDQRVFDMMAKNIGLTLKEFEEVEDIEILIDGKTIEEAGLDVLEPEGLPVFANEY